MRIRTQWFNRGRWGAAIAALAITLLGTLLLRAALSQPSFMARASDKAAASRTVEAPGGTDTRDMLPSGDLIAGNGRVEPKGREVRVAAAVPGRVAVFRVQDGSDVKSGDVLVELEATTERAALQTAEAELTLAKAELARTVRGERSEDVDAVVAESAAAEARATLAATELARTQRLASDGALAGEALDRARGEADALAATSRAAKSRAAAAKAGSRPEDILAARARVKAAEARRDQQQEQLDRLVVRAPFDGQVLQVKFRVSEYYDPRNGEPLLILGDTGHLRVRMDVDERDVGRVALQAPAFVTAEAFPGKRFTGHVVEVGHRMGRKNIRTDEPTDRLDTKILEVVLELDDAASLLPGMRVTSYIEK